VLRGGAAASAAVAFSPLLRGAGGLAAPALAAPRIGPGPYGPPQASNLDGIMVPKGFKVREIARGGVPVGLTGYPWHPFSDGSGSFRQPDGSWIFVSNSEVPAAGPVRRGGVSAIHFNADGSIRDAYRILDGSDTNCGGGTTPWGTWLSGEEVDEGLVWECDPKGKKKAVARPALGVFSHEYVVVHARQRRLYLTEDQSGGGFYRFKPARWGDLSKGLLEIATLRPDGFVSWAKVPDPLAGSKPTRDQVPAASKLKRPEGLCIDPVSGVVYFVESSAGRVYAYDPVSHAYDQVYAEDDYKSPILTDPDNAIVCPRSGDLLVCEDAGDFDICLITTEGVVARFVHMDGFQHGEPTTDASSETTGPSFDPSGTRLYFASQRAYVSGAVYEVTGPWRKRTAPPEPDPGKSRPRPGPLPLRFRIEAFHDLKASRLPRYGMRVSLIPSQRVDVEVVLRAPRRNRKKGQSRWVVLGRVHRKGLPRGRTKVHLSLSDRGERYVAGVHKKVDGQLVATATNRAGRRVRVTRPVTIS
jgi:hypothetical protein